MNQDVNIELCEKVMKDDSFLNKIKQKLTTSKSLMLDSKIEGASLYRDLCKLLSNLLSIDFDDEEDSLNSSSETIKPNESQNKIKSKSSRSLANSKMNENTENLNKNTSRQLKLMENFTIYLDIPLFFIDLLKLFIHDKSSLKSLKEVCLI